MTEILHGCEHFVVPYLDDVAIYCNSWKEHLNNLNAVLTRINDAGLSIKPIKCKFAYDRAKYLSHIVGRVAPLTETLKGKLKKGKINWTEECTRAFKEFKEKLSQQPILYTPDFNKEFILQTDASNSSMVVILAQKDDNGKEHPVLYLRKTFSETEKKSILLQKENALP
ncbi:hypothetical protein AVEN_27515-1 [Araneus ventricosus]|uniref:Retrovirus-related Pol polyprotein from transposon 17.6 n=1 Tax=Araneus ventricosus TaxID=182803 RepID=A0A4Y2MM82_ARAVE|nr:hypothetical protein AVEN_27515-1 [Araneus ventricosus]